MGCIKMIHNALKTQEDIYWEDVNWDNIPVGHLIEIEWTSYKGVHEFYIKVSEDEYSLIEFKNAKSIHSDEYIWIDVPISEDLCGDPRTEEDMIIIDHGKYIYGE